MTSAKDIILLPWAETEDEAALWFYKATYHFGLYPDGWGKIHLMLDDDLAERASAWPDGLPPAHPLIDSAITAKRKSYSSRLVLHRRSDNSWIGHVLKTENIVLLWNETRFLSSYSMSMLTALGQRGSFANCDPRRMPMDVEALASFAFNRTASMEHQNSYLATQGKRLIKLVLEHKDRGVDKIYALGAGPSVKELAEHHSFDDGTVLFCGSIISDKDLCRRINARIFVFVDEMYTGISTCMSEIRGDIKDFLADSPDRWVVCRAPFDEMLRSTLADSELEERVIGIMPRGGRRVEGRPHLVAFNLLEDFALESTVNVATELLIPLATTLGRRIVLAGMDGDAELTGTARSGDPLERSLVECHPGYSYHQRHALIWNLLLKRLSKAGFMVESATPSHVPAIQRRYHG